MAKKLTPKELNTQREIENLRRERDKEKNNILLPDSNIVNSSSPESYKSKGTDKLVNIIIDKTLDLKILLVPIFLKLINSLDEKTKLNNNEICDISYIKNIISERNELVTRLNITVNIINKNKQIINLLNQTSDTLNSSLKTLISTRVGLSIGAKIIPSPPGTPGVIVSGINDLKNAQDLLTPKIEKLIGNIDNLTMVLSISYFIIFGLLQLLNLLDSKIEQSTSKCDDNYFKNKLKSELISINDNLKELERIQNEINQENLENKNANMYKGFILDIVEEKFTPTVKKNRAVAKNSQGIILLRTESSFTTIPQLLIQELKLLIDKNNLTSI